ncbi:hypothetical protein TNIN_353201 [Trichonephila inaurata madagascariensis]|uniref:Uncharacterized protein n=1 Tax=Trichonephila inaurata madagascariensis TaxID=2747483 RepID=A0A8X6YLB1_9ARAC|nr:hypothetical protein TNIN_353201 [Trichonephila inaurata madagascariensis]
MKTRDNCQSNISRIPYEKKKRICGISINCIHIRLDCFRLDMLAPFRAYLRNVDIKLATTSSSRKMTFQKHIGITHFEMVNPYFNKDPSRLDVLAPEKYARANSREKALSVARDCDWSKKLRYLKSSSLSVDLAGTVNCAAVIT